MKKIALFVSVLLLAGAVAYAEDAPAAAPASVSVSGAVKAQFGADLDQGDTGFNWAADGIQLVIKPQVATGGVTKADANDDKMYGEIGIGGLRLEADNGWNGLNNDWGSQNVVMKWDALWVKLVLADLTIKLRNGPGTDINYEGAAGTNSYYLANAYNYPLFDGAYGSGNVTSAYANSWESWNTKYFHTPAVKDSIATNYAIQVAYSVPKIVDISLDAGSKDSWSNAATENQYAFRGCVNLTAVDGLTLAAGANFAGYTPDEYLAFGGKVGYKIGLGDVGSITPMAAIDVKTDNANALSVSGGVDATVAKAHITAYAGFLNAAVTPQINFTVAADVASIDNLILQAALEGTNVAAAAGNSIGLHSKIGYAIKADAITITPSAQVSYDTKAVAAGELYAKFEVKAEGLLENTQFFLNWNSNNLSAAANQLGELVFTTRVSF